MSESPRHWRKPFSIGVGLGVVGGLALGSTLAAIFGDDVSTLVRRLIKRITGDREEPNYEILLQ